MAQGVATCAEPLLDEGVGGGSSLRAELWRRGCGDGGGGGILGGLSSCPVSVSLDQVKSSEGPRTSTTSSIYKSCDFSFLRYF